MSSRTSVLDWVMCIGQLCCLYDHLGEEEMNLLAEREEVNPEEIAVLLSIDEDLACLKQEQEALHNELINFRKATYRFLGRLVGWQPAECGRCLADVIEKSKEEVGA